MKVLFIYPNAEGYGRVSLGISVIMSALVEKGHQIDLFDSTFILKTENTDNILREQSGLVLPTNTSHLYDSHFQEDVDEMLREKVKSFSPDLVAVTIVEENYPLADHFLGIIKSLDNKMITIVGGSTPTVAPEVILGNPLIDFLVQGEGEEATEEGAGGVLAEIGVSEKEDAESRKQEGAMAALAGADAVVVD